MSHVSRMSYSHFRHRIESHFEDRNLDIVCRKRRRGYAIYWADDGTPLARLRSVRTEDDVEVDYWDFDHWQLAGSGTTLSLEKALEYVTDDPDDLFFEADADPPGESPGSAFNNMPTDWQLLCAHVVACSLLCGAVGGVGRGPGTGLVWGLIGGYSIALLTCALWDNWRRIPLRVVCIGTPIALVAGTAGTIGGSINEAMAGGVWGAICGAVVAQLCSWLTFKSARFAWLIAAAAGTALGMRLAGSSPLQGHFVGWFLVVLFAAGLARLYSGMARLLIVTKERIVFAEQED